MYLFWYRFVRPNTSSIIRGVGQQVYDTLVMPQLNDFMGQVLEEICKQYLFLPQIYASLQFSVGEIGHWWGSNPKVRRQEEIDLMAVSDKKALFFECKWRREKADYSVMDTLLERGELFTYPEKYYYIFSESGFTGEVKEFAEKNKNVTLVDFGSMYSGKDL